MLKNYPQLTDAANKFLNEIHEQLPQDAGYLFEVILDKLATPPKKKDPYEDFDDEGDGA